MSISFIEEVLPGIDYERSLDMARAVSDISLGKMPESFRRSQWNEQMERYLLYWYWWQGKALEETVGKTKDGELLYKYPLKINPLRNYARIHNAMLWGEIRDDDSPLVNTRAKLIDLTSDVVDSKSRDRARFVERVIDHVWQQSGGRAIQWEGGLLSQFLGGYYYQLAYQPWRTDLLLPLTIRPLKPDFVLPIPNPDNPFELLEAFVIYRITPEAARQNYGVSASNATFVTYCEHWTRDRYSIFIDGKPLEAVYNVPLAGKTTISYNNQPNPFGFVPIVYIPRLREGNFYGSAITPDVLGLIREYNARFADAADILARNSNTVWLGRNINKATPRALESKDGDKPSVPYYDLGSENPAFKHPPELWSETPPVLSDAMIAFNGALESQLEREGGVSAIAFGEDEGSQRSGTTLQIRLYPTIAQARAQRHFWTTGLGIMGKMIMSAIGNIDHERLKPYRITPSELLTLQLGVQWHPYIPRDEEQATNRIVLLKQSGAMSTERAVALQPDVEDVEEEVARIRADVAALAKAGTNQEADMMLDSPVATSTTEDGE